jgi:hypothetical protein
MRRELVLGLGSEDVALRPRLGRKSVEQYTLHRFILTGCSLTPINSLSLDVFPIGIPLR